MPKPLLRRLTVPAMGAAFLVLLSSVPVAPPAHLDATPSASGGWLTRLNAWRANAGLTPLTENTTWSAGDYNHAVYMVKNDLVTHYETSGTPYYTLAGDTAARNSNIYVSSSTSTTDEAAIDWWMGAPFHALGMMDPRLTATGFGSYRETKSGWNMGAALDVLRGNSFTGGNYPVYFPGDGTYEPLTTYSGFESPDPLQACPGYSMPAGLPVFVEVGGNVSTTVGAHTFAGNGVPLDNCVIDSNNASVGSSLKSRGAVILIPRQPLQTGVKYNVALTVNGLPYTWSFSVGSLTWGVWSASFDMSTVPTSWLQGVTQTFPVKVTNTGTVTWPSTGYNSVDLDLHFATSAGGSAKLSSWLTSQAISISGDLAPGSSTTVTFTLSPPLGATVLEALMIREHEFWFDTVTTSPQQWASVPVTVTPQTPVWSASYDMSMAPATWTPGQKLTFPVKVTNTGNQTWPATGYYEVDLDLHFATSPGGSANLSNWLTSQAFALPNDLAPNAAATVNVTVTAPTSGGSLVLEAEMIKEHQFWFQQWQPVNVTVLAPAWSASYDMTKAPAGWVAGQPQTFPVTVTNTGNVTWPSTGYYEVDLDLHFATSAGGSSNQGSWSTSQAFALPTDVAPNQSVTVNVTVAPGSGTGQLTLEAEMIKEHAFWFQQWQPVNVTVNAAVWSATYNLSGVPTTWTSGQSRAITVTVTNTGNVTWPHGPSYTEIDIDFHFTTRTGGASTQAFWLTSQAFSLPNDVAPGQSVTVTVTVTAPTTAGAMFLEAQMIQEHTFWFQQTQAVAVTVS